MTVAFYRQGRLPVIVGPYDMSHAPGAKLIQPMSHAPGAKLIRSVSHAPGAKLIVDRFA